MTHGYSYAHSRKRAHQRYGIDLTIEAYHRFGRQIERRDVTKARFMVKQSAQRSVWLLWADVQWCVVVWSDRVKRILTFLPLHAEFDDNSGSPLFFSHPSIEMG